MTYVNRSQQGCCRRYLEDWHLPGVLDETADPDLTLISPGWPTTRGLQNVKQLAAALFAALAERRLTMEEMIGEGDKVAAYYTVRSTTREPLPSPDGTFVIPAGKTVNSSGVSIMRLRGGKILEERAQMDWLPFQAAAR